MRIDENKAKLEEINQKILKRDIDKQTSTIKKQSDRQSL